jgi:SulP family sulfate permease
VLGFKELFNYSEDPKSVILELEKAHVMDFSALEAIDSVAIKYRDAGIIFTVVRPGPNCRTLLENAENITAITIEENYKEEV